MKLSKTDRLRILLKNLDRLAWRELPPKVGLKTAIEAQDQGYIDLTIEPQKRYLCRLTISGQTLKRRLLAMERTQAHLDLRLQHKTESA